MRIKIEKKRILNYCEFCGHEENETPVGLKGQSFKFNDGLITEIIEDEFTPLEIVVDKVDGNGIHDRNIPAIVCPRCGKSTNSETQGG